MPIILSTSGTLDALDREIESRARLLQILRHLREDRRPPLHTLDTAPVLRDWTPSVRPIVALRGRASGHPILADTQNAITAPAIVIAPDLDFALTESRIWRLGRCLSEPFDA